MDIEQLRKEVLEANLDLKRENLIISTWGNVSGFDSDKGIMLIKASGVPYDKMNVKHIVPVDLDGKSYGPYKPSTDWKTHLVIYRSFSDQGIHGIVHTHSMFATIWAQYGIAIPNYGTTHSDYFRGPIPITRAMTHEEIEEDYEGNTGKLILEALKGKNCREFPAVLVRDHAPFCWGADVRDAVNHAKILEYVAKMATFNYIMSNGKCPETSNDIANKHYERKFGKNAYYGQSVEI